jgi:hypothetical protein
VDVLGIISCILTVTMTDSTKLFAFASSSNFFLLDGYYLLEVLVLSSGISELGLDDFRNAILSQSGGTVEAG